MESERCVCFFVFLFFLLDLGYRRICCHVAAANERVLLIQLHSKPSFIFWKMMFKSQQTRLCLRWSKFSHHLSVTMEDLQARPDWTTLFDFHMMYMFSFFCMNLIKIVLLVKTKSWFLFVLGTCRRVETAFFPQYNSASLNENTTMFGCQSIHF